MDVRPGEHLRPFGFVGVPDADAGVDAEGRLDVSDVITVMNEWSRLATGSPVVIAADEAVQQEYLGLGQSIDSEG